MLIFGWGRTRRRDFGAAFDTDCVNCRNKVVYHLLRIQQWFTLFFIPVFPYKTKHLFMCPVCRHAVPVQGRDDLLRALQMVDEMKRDSADQTGGDS